MRARLHSARVMLLSDEQETEPTTRRSSCLALIHNLRQHHHVQAVLRHVNAAIGKAAVARVSSFAGKCARSAALLSSTTHRHRRPRVNRRDLRGDRAPPRSYRLSAPKPSQTRAWRRFEYFRRMRAFGLILFDFRVIDEEDEISSDCAGPASGVASREGQKALIFQ